MAKTKKKKKNQTVHKLTPISGVDLAGKLLRVSDDSWRDADADLFVCEDGFGCSPTARGSALFGYFIKSGAKTRMERYDVVGVVAEKGTELYDELLKPYLKPACPKCNERGKLKAHIKATIICELNYDGTVKTNGSQTDHGCKHTYVCGACDAKVKWPAIQKANDLSVGEYGEQEKN